ncbi:AraC family transcriptional regulator [Paenibacillus sp. FSL H8-0034]|uniref:AraC family transcriptional regulator n=1 Tax=Paenibacillus sp. FSL H8-0034 TaxID=2954671 RepID=UPI0030F55B62
MSDNPILQALRLNYLYAEKFNFPKEWKYYESEIPYSMIRFIHKGNATFIIDENTYHLEEDDIIYIPQGSTLACEATTDDFSFMSIRFTAAFPLINSEVWSEIFGVDTKIRCDDPQMKYYFNCIIREKDSAKKGKNFMLRGYLELIVGYLINSSEAFETRSSKPRTIKLDNKNDSRVENIVSYMLNNYQTNMSIEEMSRMVNLSSSSLRRLFKQHTGKAPSEFLTELKMVVAAKRILETDARISDIAYQVGIEDPNYFSRMFKKHYGVTPFAYRQLARD